MSASSGTAQRGRAVRRPDAALRGRFAVAAAALTLLLVPFFADAFATGVLTKALAFALLVAALDLLTGFAGLPSLGQAAFFGVGAYATGLLTKDLTTVGPLLLLLGGLAGALAAAASGWLAVKSRGAYFIAITLAIGAILAEAAESLSDLTGGSDGLIGVPPVSVVPGAEPLMLAGTLYWYVLVAFVVCLLALRALVRSPFGLTLRGIRDNEARMRALGYWTAGYKYGAFCIAGALCGVAGALWMAQVRFFSPPDMGFHMSALALIAVVVGGAGTLWGPCLAGGLIVMLQELLPESLQGTSNLILGVLFVTVVYVMPRGFAGIAARPAAGRGSVA